MPRVPTQNISTAASTSSSPSSYRFNFGKHRGKLLNQVPKDYLQWCLEAGVLRTRPDLKAAMAAEETRLATRSRETIDGMKEQFPPWLWKACNDYIDEVLDEEEYSSNDLLIGGAKRAQREEMLQVAFSQGRHGGPFIDRYPPRPAELLPSSPSVDKLREVLSRSPRLSDFNGDHYGQTEDAGISCSYDHFSGDADYDWALDFAKEVARALVGVIEEHGVEGWESARWEVRDTYAERVQGLHYEHWRGERYWVDYASGWLERKKRYAGDEFKELNALLEMDDP